MKTKHIVSLMLLLLTFGSVKAQFVVTDPANLAQSIVNTTQQIVQTSSTARNMINNFREVEKYTIKGKNTMTLLKKSIIWSKMPEKCKKPC